MVAIICKNCGVEFFRSCRTQGLPGKRGPVMFCSFKCRGETMRGEMSSTFRGGREVLKTGYVRLLVRDNPRAYRNRMFEHLVLAEAALGRPLPTKAVVHHFDCNRSNNSPGNLVLCEDQAYHLLLHARSRRLRELGSLDLRRCQTCDEVKPLQDFVKDKGSWDGHHTKCRPCMKAYKRDYYLRTHPSQVC